MNSSRRRAPSAPRDHHTLRALLVALALSSGLVSQGSSAATFTVRSLSEAGDFTPGDGSCLAFISLTLFQCTLRAAIEEANALPGHDTIRFDSAPVNAAGWARFAPATPYPLISERLTIDGYTAPGLYTAPSYPTPIVQIDGAAIGVSAVGFWIDDAANQTLIRGVAVTDFSLAGIRIDADNSWIQGSHIGIRDGYYSDGNGGAGIWLHISAEENVIGLRGQYRFGQHARRNPLAGHGRHPDRESRRSEP